MENLEAVYGYSDTFNLTLPNDAFGLLRKYSTKNILIKIAHINAIIFSEKNRNYNIKIFEEVLFGQILIVKRLIPNLDYKLNKGNFFASPHLSELIKEVLNNYSENEEDHLAYEEFSIDFFITILIFNQKYNNKLAATSNLTSFHDVFALSVLQQYYIRTIIPVTYLVKFAFICNFLSKDSQLRDVTISFCKDYGIGSPWNISKFLIDLYKNNFKFVLEKAIIPAAFLKDWTLNKEYIKRKKSLTLNFEIIPRPLFESSKNELIVLDYNFFQFTIDQGFFYRIFEKTLKDSNTKLKDFNSYKSYIGIKYFEDFLCKKLIYKTFAHRKQIIYSDNKYQDFLVKTTSTNLLVIEAKMTEINAKTLEEVNFESFKQKIEDNFLSKKEIKGKNKGVYQILHQLHQICDNQNHNEVSNILKIKSTKKLNIYPILLTSDTNYNIFGTNAFVNEKCFADFAEFKGQYQTVKPVLILNVNTLIEYFGYFSRNKDNFTNLIKAYFKEIDRQKKLFHSNKNIYNYLMYSIPFDIYIQKKLKNETLVDNFDIFSKSFSDELSSLDFS
ncbi:hypothetical protein E6C50_02795 [Flavobacterium supellecticarium]|uniref:Uncharacterized protein n=1 Tax=Flavobacterium supellecticarium TaxID=2565924 RepID=A0A4S4A3Y0_9FLAO|nr:hypothetical protein [Flavobacterium supellecticarium]THF53149.1 hypothetical protein E6C50_02795 [Flavobacterium supellecticarium]